MASIQFDQMETLRGQNLVSQLRYDEAATQLKAAQTALDHARDNLAYTRLTAPFAGVVGRVHVENFQTVEENARVVLVHNIDQLEIEFSIPEQHIIGLERRSVGDDREICGRISMSSDPGADIAGCFSRFESVADPVTRNYRVYFSFARPDGLNILPGMSATIELDMTNLVPEGSEATFYLPLGAIFEKDGGSWVWRVTADMTTEPVAIDLVELRGNLLEVRSTLGADDRIVGAAAAEIREGMQVREIIRERGL